MHAIPHYRLVPDNGLARREHRRGASKRSQGGNLCLSEKAGVGPRAQRPHAIERQSKRELAKERFQLFSLIEEGREECKGLRMRYL